MIQSAPGKEMAAAKNKTAAEPGSDYSDDVEQASSKDDDDDDYDYYGDGDGGDDDEDDKDDDDAEQASSEGDLMKKFAEYKPSMGEDGGRKLSTQVII